MFLRLINFYNRDYDSNFWWKIRNYYIDSPKSEFWRWRYWKILYKNNAFIPIDTMFASKPIFPHGIHGVFISAGAQLGHGCTVFHQVTIGSNTLRDSKRPGSPIIGDNVYIGAGAKIIGNVKIGDNVRIGANCVITKDIPDNSTVVLNSPNVILYEKPRNNSFMPWNQYSESNKDKSE